MSNTKGSIGSAVNKLVEDKRTAPELGKPKERPPIPASEGFAPPLTPEQESTGTGIASPLTESNFDSRTYHPDEVVLSSDGLYAFVIRRVASITMADANGQQVVFNFAQPG
jgi:hypothetical protein